MRRSCSTMPGCSRRIAERCQRGSDRGRRRRGGVDEGPGRIEEELGDLAGRAHVGAVAAERLAERSHHHVHLPGKARRGHRAPAAGTKGPGSVGLVHHQHAPVAARQLVEIRERRDIAVHREDAVGDDQRGTRACAAQAPLEVLGVAVAVHEHLRPAEPAAVDDARVVELVGEDHLAGPAEGRDRARVRQVAGPEQQRGLGTLEIGEPFLERAVNGHRPRDQTRPPGSSAVAFRGVGGGCPDLGVVGESQVVVGAEEERLAAVQTDP